MSDYATKQLISYLDNSVIPRSASQALIKSFESLDLSSSQRRYVLIKLMKPLIRQANKQYDEGLAVGKMMGDPWDNPWEEDESSEGYYY